MTNHEQLAERRPLSGDVVEPPPGGRYPEWREHRGRTVALEPLDPERHTGDLYDLSHGEQGSRTIWDYLPYGPFPDRAAFGDWLRSCAASADSMFFAVRDGESGRASGMASYLNIVPLQGSIEIGHIWFAPAIQATTATTEAIYLMMRYAMTDLRYRRLEWKCNALNTASRRAANRLGFQFEGIFYNHVIVKGHNRDTAWYSIIDREWSAIDNSFQRWLDPSNFDADGRQKLSLSNLNRGGEEQGIT